ncbi:MAG: hypothetical protein K0S65_4464, partial [Labilithrix sp.]|nr:hypothetical protein [Labilithrix sp.]
MSSHPISRRALLSIGASIGLMTLAPVRAARADTAGAAMPSKTASRITRVSSDERGVTLMMELEHAPFPAPGSWHRDPSVLVFVPHHHRPAPGGAVQLVVHFHGHNSNVERATTAHQLREQLFDSKQNAILVVPELAANTPDSSAGKLETPGAFA